MILKQQAELQLSAETGKLAGMPSGLLAERISAAIPQVNQSESPGASTLTAEALYSGGLGEREALQVAELLEKIRDSGSSVGFKLKVNDLPNLVGQMKSRFLASRASESKIPLLPPLYKGVSFNPSTFNSTSGRREWIMLLDFCSFMASLSKNGYGRAGGSLPRDVPVVDYAVLDASFYWIVNLLGDSEVRLNAVSPEDAAGQLVDLLKRSVFDEKFKGVYEVARIRNAYLRAIAKQFPADRTPPVFTILDVWQDERFKGVLGKTLPLFCERTSDGLWRVVDSVKYERYMPYSPWVTPLIAAEFAFLQKYFGFSSNLAPLAEAAWDKIVSKACLNLGGSPYVTFSYSRSVASWLPYDSIPFFSDSEGEVLRKLCSSQSVKCGLPELAVRMIAPFDESSLQLVENAKRGDLIPVAKAVRAFCSTVDSTALSLLDRSERIPSLPLQNAGWLMAFPAGLC